MTRPLTSIVILARNGEQLTRDCLDSIARHTPEPHEVIVVDNGSTDGTLGMLRERDVLVIDNGCNRGFGGGCNQGIAAALGERVLLLNNDVVVTAGWLGALHDALDVSATTGIAGPRSNMVAGSQIVAAPGYDTDTLDGLDAWAASWSQSHRGQVEPVQRLIGFCMLIERAVVDRVGGFDLRYGIGNFEDDDLCLRAIVGGFGCVIAHSCFIHHHGSRTFESESIDYTATMTQNLQRFADAWQLVEGDLDRQTGGYRPDRLLARATWDARRHHAPLVAERDDDSSVTLDERRGHLLVICCDRLDPAATARSIDAALDAVGPADDVTILVRIDPDDAASPRMLDVAADRVGDANLPDIALLMRSDANDLPVLRSADTVLVDGRLARSRGALALYTGAHSLTVQELRERSWLTERARR